MVGSKLSHYEILSKIGAGGMGEVYRARDTRLGRDVAIKVLPQELRDDPERRERLEAEAKAIAALNHPNIVTIHSIEETDGILFLTMELVEGTPLSETITGSTLSLQSFLEIGVSLSQALAAAHERAIIHRDLKPANVIVGPDGRVKVLDFGMAKVERPTQVSTGVDTVDVAADEGRVLGTVPYMSPEQVKGATVDARSDLFSLGVILYELATGRRPFDGEGSAELVSSILRDPPDWTLGLKPGLPRGLQQIIGRCLEKEPGLRYQDAREVRAALERLRRVPHAVDASSPSPSVAVLPFADMSPEKDQGYFCEGIAEEIINALAKIRDLRVASRSLAFQLEASRTGSRELGRRLGVETLLEGSVRKAGERLRVTAQLVSVADGYTLWSERYDREMQDVFAIQDEIAENIAGALEVRLDPRQRRRIQRIQTSNVEAYDFYLRGRRFFYRVQRTGMEFARQMFTHAIERDPDYALAYAGIADCCSWLFMYFDSAPANLQQALVASRKALQLDPVLAEAHASRGQALMLDGSYEEAEREFERAADLDPRLFEAYYFHARSCFMQGRFEQAVDSFEKAAEVNPTDYQSHFLRGNALEGLRDAARASAAYEVGVQLVERRLQLEPDDVRALYLGAHGLLRLGARERAVGWMERALALDPADPGTLYNVACFHALDGNVDAGLDFFERALAAGYAHQEWVQYDVYLDPLRGHSRFAAAFEGLR
ncbi:MAG: protein kinase [Candidatus Krumholzibacteriia bacterium]